MTALGAEALDDADLNAAVKRELSAWYGGAVSQLRLLKVIRIPFAQFAQPAGFGTSLPDNETASAQRPHRFRGDQYEFYSRGDGERRAGGGADFGARRAG